MMRRILVLLCMLLPGLSSAFTLDPVELLTGQTMDPDQAVVQAVKHYCDSPQKDADRVTAVTAVAALRCGMTGYAAELLAGTALSNDRPTVAARILVLIQQKNHAAAQRVLQQSRSRFAASPQVFRALQCLLAGAQGAWESVDRLAAAYTGSAPVWKAFFLLQSVLANEQLQRYPLVKKFYLELHRIPGVPARLKAIAAAKSAPRYRFQGDDMNSRRQDLLLQDFSSKTLAAARVHLKFYPADIKLRIHVAEQMLAHELPERAGEALSFLEPALLQSTVQSNRRRALLCRSAALFCRKSFGEAAAVFKTVVKETAGQPFHDPLQDALGAALRLQQGGALPEVQELTRLISGASAWKMPFLYQFWLQQLIAGGKYREAELVADAYLAFHRFSLYARFSLLQARMHYQPFYRWGLGIKRFSLILLDKAEVHPAVTALFRGSSQKVRQRIGATVFTGGHRFSRIAFQMLMHDTGLSDERLVQSLSGYHALPEKETAGFLIAANAVRSRRWRIALEFLPGLDGVFSAVMPAYMIAGQAASGSACFQAGEFFFRRIAAVTPDPRMQQYAAKQITMLRLQRQRAVAD